MLGPSILLASTPFCTVYALNASLYARPKIAAFIGLALAAAELLTLIVLVVVEVLRALG